MKDELEDFRLTIERGAARLRLISESESLAPLSDGKWSAKEVIGHLIDSASHNHQRFVRAQLEDEMVFPTYEQEEWVRVQRYQEESWPLLVQLWESYNLHLLHVISWASVETCERKRTRHNLHRIAWRTVPESEPVTLRYFMLDYIGHLKNHLRQIFKEDASVDQ